MKKMAKIVGVVLLSLGIVLGPFGMFEQRVQAATTWNFSYTGADQTWTAPSSGTYKLEVWGSQGRYSTKEGEGGYGGYSYGEKYITAGTTLYVCVGGNQVMNFNFQYHTYGNGGKGDTGYGGAGGGATDIRTISDNLYSRIIVAGGGGGGAKYDNGGVGGGTSGGNGDGTSIYEGGGATQSSGGTGGKSYGNAGGFGWGGSSDWGNGGGGGGGWYGGGGGLGGGGGSGYIGGVTNGGMSSGVNSGTGRATITLAGPVTPSAPTLSAYAASSSSISLYWNTISDATRYYIYNSNGSLITYTSSTSYTVTGLSASTTYSYYVKAYNSAGYSVASNTASATTLTSTPSAPTLSAYAASSSSISLYWNTVAGAARYYIYNSNGLLITYTSSTSYTVTGLSASTTYSYYVKAYNSAGYSAASNTASATTLINVPPAPTLSAYAASSSSISLYWNTATGATRYYIYNSSGSLITYTTSTSYTVTGLSASTTYSYYVKAYNSAGYSAASNTASATTQSPPPAPTASPGGGTYNSTKYVTLSDAKSGVTIRYTTNGSEPTISSTVYSSAITISSTTTLKAKAWDAAGSASSTMTQTYTIDTTPPANPSISISPTVPTNGNVTVTITYPGDAAIKSYNINGGIPSSYTGAFTVSSNCTINASCADAVGNWSGEISYVINNIHIYPTLNTPIITGSIYLGEDVTLTDTGTDIDQAVYRVYYTTNVSAPTLTDGAENPGAGWVDSGVSGVMIVAGGTGVSKIIAGTSLSNNNWTHVTFKVWAASSTNDSVTKYSQAYVVSNDGNSAINYVGHNQIIKIFNTNSDVVVSDPNTPVEAYNPDPTSVGYLEQNNLFENQNPFMKYRLEFDILKPQIVKNIEIDFDFNYYNDYWIEFRPKTMTLEKLNDDGTVAGILQTYNIDGATYTKQSTNRYILKLGNDNEGNPIIQVNGQGRYAVEYTGELIVQTDNRVGTVLMRHNAEVYIFTTTSIYPDTLEAQRPSRKFYIDTKVTKFDVRYH